MNLQYFKSMHLIYVNHIRTLIVIVIGSSCVYIFYNSGKDFCTFNSLFILQYNVLLLFQFRQIEDNCDQYRISVETLKQCSWDKKY